MIFLIFTYTFFINVLGAFFMFSDKKKAVKGQWRIKEQTLFNVALIGGSLGILIGIKLFRHKTKPEPLMTKVMRF